MQCGWVGGGEFKTHFKVLPKSLRKKAKTFEKPKKAKKKFFEKQDNLIQIFYNNVFFKNLSLNIVPDPFKVLEFLKIYGLTNSKLVF